MFVCVVRRSVVDLTLVGGVVDRSVVEFVIAIAVVGGWVDILGLWWGAAWVGAWGSDDFPEFCFATGGSPSRQYFVVCVAAGLVLEF